MGNFNYVVPGNTLETSLINSTIPQTLWQKIFLHLEKLGYEVYSPGQKRDKCQNSYVVIKENGTSAMIGNVAGYKMFDIIIYHPMDAYSTMEPYVENIKEAINLGKLSKIEETLQYLLDIPTTEEGIED